MTEFSNVTAIEMGLILKPVSSLVILDGSLASEPAVLMIQFKALAAMTTRKRTDFVCKQLFLRCCKKFAGLNRCAAAYCSLGRNLFVIGCCLCLITQFTNLLPILPTFILWTELIFLFKWLSSPLTSYYPLKSNHLIGNLIHQEDLLSHGDEVYDIIEDQDKKTIRTELLSNDEDNQSSPSAKSLQQSTSFPSTETRIALCRMNVSRNARRQMRFGDQKVVLIEGHYFGFLPLSSRDEPVFLATCTPIAMPETRECVVQGSTNVFTSIHSMDMKFLYIDGM